MIDDYIIASMCGYMERLIEVSNRTRLKVGEGIN
jgi:hypothetical protein